MTVGLVKFRSADFPNASVSIQRDKIVEQLEGRLMVEEPIRASLSNAELNTIVMALKLGRVRYGMLLQLAHQCERPVLNFDSLADLVQSLEGILREGGQASA